MKKSLKILCALAFLATIPGAHAQGNDQPVVNPYGSAFEGEGVEIEMAQFVAKNKAGIRDVLLVMRGANAFNAGIDGKTLRYEAVPTANGVDYRRDGKTAMAVRNMVDGASGQIQVYLDGKTIPVGQDRSRSRDVQPLHLLTAAQGGGN